MRSGAEFSERTYVAMGKLRREAVEMVPLLLTKNPLCNDFFFLRETSTLFILTQWLLEKKNQRHVHVVVLGSPDFVLFYFSTILFPLISFNSNRLSFLLLGNVNFLLHLRLYQSTTTIFPAFLNQQTSFVYWKITNWVKHMPRGFSSVQVLVV